MQDRDTTMRDMGFSVGGVACRLIRVNPELAPPSSKQGRYYQHRHPTLELHAVRQGQSCVVVNKHPIALRAGQLLLIPPGSYHYVKYAPPHPVCMTISVQISPPSDEKRTSGAQRFCTALSPAQPRVVDVAPGSELELLLRRIRTLVDQPRMGFAAREKLRSVSALLLLELCDALAGQDDRPESGVAVTPQDYTIDEFFGRSFRRNNGGRVLAEQLNVSTRQLSRIIRRNYGMNYREKLRETRMEIAADLLVNTDQSIAQIAQQMGYGSSASFSAFVKRAAGKPPLQLRRDLRREQSER